MTCVNSAVGALQALPGVQKVDGNTHSFTVTYDPARVSVDQLRRVVEDNEFRVTDVTSN